MHALRKPTQQLSEQDQPTPRTWLVLGDKRGDNAQVEMVAGALGWPCERRNLVMRARYVVGKPWVRPSLHHIDLTRSDRLEPPWPDLVITVGRRPSMAALWIARQSGGRTKLVLIGKPSGMTRRFDLIVAGAETRMPALPNVLTVTLPLMRVDEAAVAAAAEAWRPRLADLPRPLIGFMVGGPTGPFRFDDTVAKRLLALIGEVAAAGGTPYVSTSRRTPPATVAALQPGLPENARLFRWTPDAPDNPYLGLLGLADGFVVTGDSISMLVEIAALRRPLAILELPGGWLGRLDMLRRRWIRQLFDPGRAGGALRRAAVRALYGARLINHTRDFAAFYDLLIERGLAVRAGEGFAPPRGEVPDELDLVVARIKALLA
jgi:mitochondrial fission protein ELM1